MKTLQKWKPSRGIDLKGNFSDLFLETMQIIDTTTWTSRKGKIICFRWPYSKGSMLHFKFFPARFILFISLHLGEKIIIFRVGGWNFVELTQRISARAETFPLSLPPESLILFHWQLRGLLHWPVWPDWNFFISMHFSARAEFQPGLKFFPCNRQLHLKRICFGSRAEI